MAVVPEPGACRAHKFPPQRVCGASTATQPSGAGPSATRLSSPKKRSRPCERRQQRSLPTAPGLWRRPDSSGGGGGGGSGDGGRAEWRMFNNKENIDPRTGLHAQHPFSPFSPFSPCSASLLVGGPAIAATATITPAAAAATATVAGTTSGRASSIQKRLFCGSSRGEVAQARSGSRLGSSGTAAAAAAAADGRMTIPRVPLSLRFRSRF